MDVATSMPDIRILTYRWQSRMAKVSRALRGAWRAGWPQEREVRDRLREGLLAGVSRELMPIFQLMDLFFWLS